MSSPIKVLLADDHAMLREGLHRLLDYQSGIEVIGEAEDGLQAIERVDALHPDVVVMDITMPRLDGLAATREIRRRHPRTRVVILSMHSGHYLHAILDAGATGYVMKSAPTPELVAAIKAAAHGERSFPDSLFGLLAEHGRHRFHAGADTAGLTPREREIVRMIALGRHNREIAAALGISVKTVETHRRHLMRKLDARDRTDVVRYAAGQHLDGVELPQTVR